MLTFAPSVLYFGLANVLDWNKIDVFRGSVCILVGNELWSKSPKQKVFPHSVDKNSLGDMLAIQKRELYVKKKNSQDRGAFSRHPVRTGAKRFRST